MLRRCATVAIVGASLPPDQNTLGPSRVLRHGDGLQRPSIGRPDAALNGLPAVRLVGHGERRQVGASLLR